MAVLGAVPAGADAAVPAAYRGEFIPAARAEATVATPSGPLRYSVTWSEHAVTDAQGVAHATLSTLAFEREAAPGTAARPVIFAFGGGPGEAASELGFGLLAPKRYALDGHAGPLQDNPDTLLDVADLVLIDTPGSGYTHALRPDGLAYLYGAKTEADSVAAAIRAWLVEHGRERSPVYIMGESYGGYRIGVMAPQLGDMNVAGLILVSPALDLSDQPGSSGTPDLHYVFALPTMAVAAVVQHRVDGRGRSVAQVFDEARAFAEGELLVALQSGAALPARRREMLARRMSGFLGIPAERIASANLRLLPQDFLESLVPDRVVGRLDVRVSGPAHKAALIEGRDRAADDPSLDIGASNIKRNDVAGAYLESIGVKAGAPYVELDLEMNLNLDWAFGSRSFEDSLRLNPTPRIAALMAAQPAARLLLFSGYYDMTTPVLAQRYSLTHAGVPLDRASMITLAGPHMIYRDEATRRDVSRRLRAFIGGTVAVTAP